MSGMSTYHRRKAAGICTNCGAVPADGGRVSCDRCAKVQAGQVKAYQQRVKEQRACRARACKFPGCPQTFVPASTMHLFCARCSGKPYALRQKAIYHARKAKGVCVRCAEHPPVARSLMCVACRDTDRARQRQRYWQERETITARNRERRAIVREDRPTPTSRPVRQPLADIPTAMIEAILAREDAKRRARTNLDARVAVSGLVLKAEKAS